MPRSLRDDSFLNPYRDALRDRTERICALERRLAGDGTLADFVSAHEYYGLHREADGSWVFRELAPNATALWLVGDFSEWSRLPDYRAERLANSEGVWELRVPADAILHGQYYRLDMEWLGGGGERLPA